MGSSITVNLLSSTPGNNGVSHWRRESSWGLCCCTEDGIQKTRQSQRDIFSLAAGPSVTSWSTAFIDTGRFFPHLLHHQYCEKKTIAFFVSEHGLLLFAVRKPLPYCMYGCCESDRTRSSPAKKIPVYHVFAEEASKEEAFRSEQRRWRVSGWSLTRYKISRIWVYII